MRAFMVMPLLGSYQKQATDSSLIRWFLGFIPMVPLKESG